MTALLPLQACGDGPTPPTASALEVSFDDGFTVYVADPATTHVQAVIRSTDAVFDVSWAPDGQRAVYTKQFSESGPVSYRLFVYDVRDGRERQLTQGPDDAVDAAWSPDGAWIAYHRRPVGSAGGAALHVIKPDGTGDRRLGDELYFVRSPAWSPDGRRIADTSRDIMVVIVDAQTGARVQTVARGMSPSWSPDGARLAFVADSLVVADLSGAHRRAIAPHAYEPAWSPDGKWIAFQRPGTGVRDGIMLAPADGRDSTSWIRIHGPSTVTPGARPSWRRRP